MINALNYLTLTELFASVDYLSIKSIVMKKTTANEGRPYIAPESEEFKIDVHTSVIMESCANHVEEPGEQFD